MGIQGVKHPRNGAIVDGLIGVYWLSVILLHHVIDVAKGAQAIAHVAVATGGSRSNLLTEEDAQKTAGDENKRNQEQRAASATYHLEIL